MSAFCPDAWRYYRRRARLRQKDLAAELGMSLANVCRYETGTIVPSPQTLLSAARIFGCEFSDLLNPPPDTIPGKLVTHKQAHMRHPLPRHPRILLLSGLRALRLSRGFTLARLAWCIGRNPNLVWQWEHGTRTSQENALRIAEVLRADIRTLIGEEATNDKINGGENEGNLTTSTEREIL